MESNALRLFLFFFSHIFPFICANNRERKKQHSIARTMCFAFHVLEMDFRCLHLTKNQMRNIKIISSILFGCTNMTKNSKMEKSKIVFDLPVIGGGSTTDVGPKNVGISPDVVTGVLRSPVCVSVTVCELSGEWFCCSAPMLCNKLRCG